MANTIKTSCSDIAELQYNEKESILYIKILEDAIITVQKAKSNCRSVKELTKNKAKFALIDASNLFSIDDDALKYIASPETTSNKKVTACFSTNLANRLTIHSFKLFHKPQFTMQLFRNKIEALCWLETYQKNVLL